METENLTTTEILEDKTTSKIQQEILKRTAERENSPKRGLLGDQNQDPLGTSGTGDSILFNFLNAGARLEIHGKSDKEYTVKFFNRETGELLKEHLNVKSGEWCSSDQEYFVPWAIQTLSGDPDNPEVKNFTIDLSGKNVLISFESSALGDTIAWIPIVEEFRKINKCNVYVCSFHNDLFKDAYKNLIFLEKGAGVHGMHFSYRLGWFGSGHASNRNPFDCQTRNLQQIAMDIFGMKWEGKDFRPSLNKPKLPRKIKQKYVAITTCSTAQFKYWNHLGGWQQIVDYLNRKGYKVVNIGKQPNILHDVINATGQLTMDDLFGILQHSEFFVGLPSGLAWLNWSLGKKTIMISGISEPFCEFQEDMYRVQNIASNGCEIRCFNDPSYTFDKGEWRYCPKNSKNIDIFKCTKTITPEMVKKKIALVEKHLKNRTVTVLDNEGNLTEKTSGALIAKFGE